MWKFLLCLPLPNDILHIIRNYWGRLHSMFFLDNKENPGYEAWLSVLSRELPHNYEYVESALQFFLSEVKELPYGCSPLKFPPGMPKCCLPMDFLPIQRLFASTFSLE